MRLVTFQDNAGERVGLMDENGSITDLGAIPGLPNDMIGYCSLDSASLQRIGEAASECPILPPGSVSLLAPIPRPVRNIFCIGKNYYDHAAEFTKSGYDGSKDEVPKAPIVFSKPPSTVIPTGAPVPGYLDLTNSVDYEGEIAVIIGNGGRGITREKALQHVFGYTIVNDVTARVPQKTHQQWLLGKGIDGFCPMGPAIVTSDELADPTSLTIQTWVNGELRQDASAKELIFDIPTLIETISQGITLIPGDIVATGTPAGVGIGFNPPRFLNSGDVVRIEIPQIGVLENVIH